MLYAEYSMMYCWGVYTSFARLESPLNTSRMVVAEGSKLCTCRQCLE